MITLDDWRHAPADIVASLYEEECARWHGSLGWDYHPTCSLIENARQSGRLPGFLARDADGEIAGWAYYLLHHDMLQIGNLVTRREVVARALLDAIACGPDARHARRLSCFLFPCDRFVEGALRRAGFSLLRHAYMQRALGETVSCATEGARQGADEYALRPWAADLVPGVVTLISAAYERSREMRCFAPDGDMGQWATYVHQLVNTPACGHFDRGLTCAVERPDGTLVAAMLVTTLSARVAHIAQMAVDSEHRRRGIGEWMVRVANERARQAGYQKMTLLVSESNDRARRLYDRLGFQQSAEFLFADR